MKKVFIAGLALAAFASLALSSAGFAYTAGDQVEVLWKGTWYKATVLSTKGGATCIHYDGYGKNWDECVGKERIRGGKASAEATSGAKFAVGDDVRALCHARVEELRRDAAAWNRRLNAHRQANPDQATLLDQLCGRTVPADLLAQLLKAVPAKENATRNTGGEILQRAAALVPALTGGAADLNPSTKTHLKDGGEFTPENRAGRNLHFGVREFAMGQIANGMALFGTAIPYTATFAVFSDFMKPALRLAAIQNQHVIFIYTHDSIFVGEDGPTHEPIEQLAMLRSIPGLTVIRPADSYETAHAWAAALEARGPVALFLTRQSVENIPADRQGHIALARGAYVLSDEPGFEAILIATGSETMVTYRAAEILRRQGRRVRVVSMPSWELFARQPAAYRDAVLPPACTRRVSVEAGCTFGWERHVGLAGLSIGLDHFGASAPYKVLAQKYGLTAEAIAAKVAAYLE